MFAKMTNMARTPDEVKKEVASYAPMDAAAKPSVASYPYGLCISLDQDGLKKLGLDGDIPEVGEVLNFCAMAKVTSVSMNESESTDGTKSQNIRIELQITDMGVPAADGTEEQVQRSEQRRKRFYADSMTADEA